MFSILKFLSEILSHNSLTIMAVAEMLATTAPEAASSVQ